MMVRRVKTMIMNMARLLSGRTSAHIRNRPFEENFLSGQTGALHALLEMPLRIQLASIMKVKADSSHSLKRTGFSQQKLI